MVAVHNPEQFQQTTVRCLHNPRNLSIELSSIRGIALHLCKACATTLAMEVEIEFPDLLYTCDTSQDVSSGTSSDKSSSRHLRIIPNPTYQLTTIESISDTISDTIP